MNCIIEWNVLLLDEWQARFDKIARSNILQAYHYAQANAKTKKQKARWGLIKIGDPKTGFQEAGLVQIQEAGLFWNAIHAVILDRGPLWFDGFGGAAHIKLFFDEFNAQFPNRFGRKRRIMPEVEAGATAEAILKQTGMTKNDNLGFYQTLWWDLDLNNEDGSDLRPNWRGSLKKAEKAERESGLSIEWDDTGRFYPELKVHYATDKAMRGYGGASPQFLDALAQFATQRDPMIIGKALLNGETIALVMFLKHGRCTTYQVGWSSDAGRQYCAHHLLLYRSRTMLQEYGVKQLDLGGINDENAGLKKFKQGTGSSLSHLIGFYT